MKFFLYFLLFLSSPVFCQHFEDLSARITPNNSFPEKLLSSKTVVFIDLPSNNAKEWNRVKEAFHQEISKSGIDAVAYYQTNVVFSGHDVMYSFIDDFLKREINNLIFLNYQGEESEVIVCQITPELFFDNQKHAGWTKSGSFKDISRAIYVQSANSGLERSNFLLNTMAEEGPLTKPVKGKVANYFLLRLNTNKLAIPKTGNLQRDFLLENTFAKHYPFEFEMVDNDISEEELQEQGFNYILRYIEAPQELLRKYLNLATKDGVTHFMSVKRNENGQEMVPISLNEIATKFYIKDLRNNDAYIGNEWDIDKRWIDAAANHIFSFREQLGL